MYIIKYNWACVEETQSSFGKTDGCQDRIQLLEMAGEEVEEGEGEGEEGEESNKLSLTLGSTLMSSTQRSDSEFWQWGFLVVCILLQCGFIRGWCFSCDCNMVVCFLKIVYAWAVVLSRFDMYFMGWYRGGSRISVRSRHKILTRVDMSKIKENMQKKNT